MILNIKSKSRLARLTPYLYLAPAVIFMLVIFIYPVVDLFNRATTLKFAGEIQNIGLQAFKSLVNDDVFWISLGNNLRLFLAVPILVLLSLVFSTLIFERIRGWQVYRTMVFIPYVMAIPVVGIVFSYILQLNGVLNTILRGVGLGFIAQDWLGTSKWAIWSIMFVVIWKELGFGIVLFLARMSSISNELFDAARLDGAGWWQRLINITIPQTATVIEFYVAINLITMLSWVFSYIIVMTKGGPGTSTWVMEYYIYQKAFQYSQMHIAAAGAIVLLVLASGLMVIQARARKRVEELGD